MRHCKANFEGRRANAAFFLRQVQNRINCEIRSKNLVTKLVEINSVHAPQKPASSSDVVADVNLEVLLRTKFESQSSQKHNITFIEASDHRNFVNLLVHVEGTTTEQHRFQLKCTAQNFVAQYVECFDWLLVANQRIFYISTNTQGKHDVTGAISCAWRFCWS